MKGVHRFENNGHSLPARITEYLGDAQEVTKFSVSESVPDSLV